MKQTTLNRCPKFFLELPFDSQSADKHLPEAEDKKTSRVR
jgi:hypothetical protein